MASRSSSKHARPAGRGALKAAYADLLGELAEVRRHRYADTLEISRLTALVDALTIQVSRLHGELSSVRHELHDARVSPPRRDPYVEVLAVEAAELRAAVSAQQSVLVELTARIVALLDRGPDVVPLPVPEAVPIPVVEHSDQVVVLTDAAGPFAAAAPSFVGDQLDDLALLRLRLIRQTLTTDVAPAVPSTATH
jgi:hypothetical protein